MADNSNAGFASGVVGKGFAISYVNGYSREAAKQLQSKMEEFQPHQAGGNVEKVSRLFIPIPTSLRFKNSLPEYNSQQISQLDASEADRFKYTHDTGGQKGRTYTLSVFLVKGRGAGEEIVTYCMCVDLGGMVQNIKSVAEGHRLTPEQERREVDAYMEHLNAIFAAEHINAEAFTYEADEELYEKLIKKCHEYRDNDYERMYKGDYMGITMAAPHYYGFLKPMLSYNGKGGNIMDHFQRAVYPNDPTKSMRIIVVIPKSCTSKKDIQDYDGWLRSVKPPLKMEMSRPGQPIRTYVMNVCEVTNPNNKEEKLVVMVNIPPILLNFPEMVRVNHIPRNDLDGCRKAFIIQLRRFMEQNQQPVSVIEYDDKQESTEQLSQLLYDEATKFVQ